MEVFLHLWDELDDLSAACRHLTASAMDEVADLLVAAHTAVAALAAWLVFLPR